MFDGGEKVSRFFQVAVSIGVLAGSVACSSFSKSFDAVQPDWDKSQVVEHLGSPTYSRRVSGRDQWIYVFYEKNRKVVREVHFEDGQIVGLTRNEMPWQKWQALQRSSSLQEFAKASGESQAFR